MSLKNLTACLKSLLGGLILLIMISSCTSDSVHDVVIEEDLYAGNSEVVTAWYDLYLDVERYTPGYRPPVSARTLGYIGIAAFQAIQPALNEDLYSITPQISDIEIPELEAGVIYDWETVLNALYERSFMLFFQSAPSKQQYEIGVLADELRQKFAHGLNPADLANSEEYGRLVADAIYKWAMTDALGHNAEKRNIDQSYIPPSGPGKWQPTFPDFLNGLTPYWGDVRAFVASPDIKAKDPLPYDESVSSQLYAQALETRVIVNEIREGKRYEDRWIADFWSDDCPILTFSPVGRWIAIATQAIEKTDMNLVTSIELFAKLGMGLSDAAVKCWGEKYRFNYIRPIDYIRNVMGDTDWNTIMCPDGSGLFYTPNFPTYPSGHATFAGAAGIILSDVFGSNIPFTDKCHENRVEFIGTPRSYIGFNEMAEECAYSRVPLGVHFRMDSEGGLDLGRKVGRSVLFDLDWRR